MVGRELGHKLQQVQVALVIWYVISAKNLVISQTVSFHGDLTRLLLT